MDCVGCFVSFHFSRDHGESLFLFESNYIAVGSSEFESTIGILVIVLDYSTVSSISSEYSGMMGFLNCCDVLCAISLKVSLSLRS